MRIEEKRSFNIGKQIKEWKFGSGGSATIIGISKGDKYAYKFFPLIVYPGEDVRVITDLIKKECWVWNILTRQIVRKNISPHIVPLENIFYYPINSFFRKCPSVLEYINSSKFVDKPCSYLYRNIPTRIQKGLYVAKSPFIPHTLASEIERISFLPRKELVAELDRILFQIIFTINIIQLRFPDFIHNDLFVRNILCFIISGYDKNDVYEYRIEGRVFHVPVDGICVFITDFGRTQLDKKTLKKFGNKHEVLRHDKEQDLFNFLYDIYDGQNLGSFSIKMIYSEEEERRKRQATKNTSFLFSKILKKISFQQDKELEEIKKEFQKKNRFIDQYFNNFLNVKFIQNVQKRYVLDNQWYITEDPSVRSKLNIRNNWEYFGKKFQANPNHRVVRVFGL